MTKEEYEEEEVEESCIECGYHPIIRYVEAKEWEDDAACPECGEVC